MTDPCLTILAKNIVPQSRSLWFATEGGDAIFGQLAAHQQLTICTNRFDVHEQACTLGLQSEFNDWQPHAAKYDNLYLRICKEKPANFHIANLASSLLTPNGKLFICGQKNEGIKTFYKTLEAQLASNIGIQKYGDAYLAILGLPETVSNFSFDSQNYTHTRVITDICQKPVYSKPGVYGWNKVDAGSAFLVNILEQHANSFINKSVLDLGCGYGYLTLATANFGAASYTATDNNAAAIQCMQQNASTHSVEVSVVAAHAGASLQERFDVILCNPPFHKSFAVDGDLTDTFLIAAKRLLSTSGAAYFVVNSFIPLESKAKSLFKVVRTLANNAQFKVIALAHQ